MSIEPIYAESEDDAVSCAVKAYTYAKTARDQFNQFAALFSAIKRNALPNSDIAGLAAAGRYLAAEHVDNFDLHVVTLKKAIERAGGRPVGNDSADGQGW